MKRIIAAVAAAAVALTLSAAVLADTGDTAADSVDTVSDIESVDEDAGKEISAEKRLGGVLLVSSVCGAMVIAALIWRGRDRTKYL